MDGKAGNRFCGPTVWWHQSLGLEIVHETEPARITAVENI